VCGALAAGLLLRKRELLVPGEGLGYMLGVIGGSLMLLLLAYPLVKRTRLFRDGSSSSFWFRWHMILGVVGPLLIFFHSNFSTGAVNSNVALFSMIVVAASGLIGRYIYSRLHQGLYGAKHDIGTLLAQATRLLTEIENDVGGANGLAATALSNIGRQMMSGNRSVGLMSVVAMPVRVELARDRIMRQIRAAVRNNGRNKGWSRREAQAHTKAARRHVDEFLRAVSRAAHLSFWERMLSLWHVAHVPLFFLLLVSGVIHVVAVHLY
jgi:hypothetical protein